MSTSSTLSQFFNSISEKAAQVDFNGIVSKVKGAVLNYTEFQIKVDQATNNDKWGASRTLMQEIAIGTQDFQNFHDIMDMTYKKMQERGSNWRQCYKVTYFDFDLTGMISIHESPLALQLLEYLLKNGSEKVLDNSQDHMYEMKALKTFKYIDDAGKDQGINVRNRADEILILIANPDKLKQERIKARENRGKYGGMSSDSYSFNSSRNQSGFGSQSPTESSYQSKRFDSSSKEQDVIIIPAQKKISEPTPPAPELINMDGDDWGDFTSASNTSNSNMNSVQSNPLRVVSNTTTQSNPQNDLFGDFYGSPTTNSNVVKSISNPPFNPNNNFTANFTSAPSNPLVANNYKQPIYNPSVPAFNPNQGVTSQSIPFYNFNQPINNSNTIGQQSSTFTTLLTPLSQPLNNTTSLNGSSIPNNQSKSDPFTSLVNFQVPVKTNSKPNPNVDIMDLM